MKPLRHYPDGLTKITDSIWAYMQPDGFYGLNNAGLVVGGDESLVIDTLFDNPRTRKMLRAMSEANPAAAEVDILVNTHSHCDHAGGNSLLPRSRRVMTEKMAQEYDRVRPEYFFGALSNAQGDGKTMLTHLLGTKFDLSDASYAPPTEIFKGEKLIKLGNTEVRLVEVGPLHTSSDVVVHIPAAGVVFAGDVMFADSHIPIHGSGIDVGIEFFKSMLTWDAEQFVPGHGGMCTRQDVQEHLDYLIFFRDSANRYYAAGVDAAEAAFRFADGLGKFAHFDRTDLILQNMKVHYGFLSGKPVHIDLNEYLGERWRFGNALRARGFDFCN